MILIKKYGTIYVQEKNTCLLYLQTRIEELADNALKAYQRKTAKNSANFISYNAHKASPNSLTGFYAVQKPEKITIYWKFPNRGYLYNSYATKKIITFFIVPPKKEKFIPREKKEYWEDKVSLKSAFWDEIHHFFNNLFADPAKSNNSLTLEEPEE